MGIASVIKNIKKRGLKETVAIYKRRKEAEERFGSKDALLGDEFHILLLTNRDSDNVGDQVIEACDISIISTVMENLGMHGKYVIRSRAAGIIPKKYIETRDESLLDIARENIEWADILVFGGAPLFNYKYQVFYERTARTLEIAKEYDTPVVFSAIGIDSYDEDNEKCQRLKKTLNFDIVKQITTRDGIDELTKYKDREDLTIGKVSDPAVFSAPVFRNFNGNREHEQKKIGIFVIRAKGFVDNGIDFTPDQAAKLWRGVILEAEKRGYDYDILTSGHFGDEAFMDHLIREYGLPPEKCVFNINYPEKLIRRMAKYDGVISCRLHPSIISFSHDIPAVGIEWNNKVSRFYESIGYPERCLGTDGISAEKVMDTLEKAMEQGIDKDREYLESVYETMFNGIKRVLKVREDIEDIEPFSGERLLNNMQSFNGTSGYERDQKLKRKFRRAYNTYNGLMHKKNS